MKSGWRWKLDLSRMGFAAAGEGVRARWQANKGSYYLRLLKILGHSTKNFKFVSEDLTYKLNEFIND